MCWAPGSRNQKKTKLWRILLSFWIFLSCYPISLSHNFLPSLATIWKVELQQQPVPDSMSSSWGKTFPGSEEMGSSPKQMSVWVDREEALWWIPGAQQLLEKACAESRVVLGSGRMAGALLVPEGKGTLPDRWSEFSEVTKNVVYYTQNEGRGGDRLKQRLRKNLLGEGTKGRQETNYYWKLQATHGKNLWMAAKKPSKNSVSIIELCGMP